MITQEMILQVHGILMTARKLKREKRGRTKGKWEENKKQNTCIILVKAKAGKTVYIQRKHKQKPKENKLT